MRGMVLDRLAKILFAVAAIFVVAGIIYFL